LAFGAERAERMPAQRDRQRHHQRARADRVPPAQGGRDRGQHEGRDHPAQREAHLLHAHRDAALARREDVHDGLAERGIHHAPARAGHEEAREKGEEAGGERGGEQPGRGQGEPAEEGGAHPEAVGEPAAGQREEQPGEIDRRDDEGDLESGEAQALDQARRQRRDPQHAEGARAV